MWDPSALPKEVIQTLKNSARSPAKIKEYIHRLNNVPLKIAITGETGSGKSSFVNGFRGLTDDSEGAAPTGVLETTKEIEGYPHPDFPNVILYDLPGIGTPSFPAKKYLKLVKFDQFDFFIIISSSRFKDNDVKLAHEIRKKKKKFYYVRSKVDIDLDNEKKREKTFNEEETLNSIRKYCVEGLEDQGYQSPQVFLISSHHLQLYDFPLLHQALERDLPEHKKNVLLFASPCINTETVYERKRAFTVNLYCSTALSAVVAGVPVPGVSVAVDLVLIVAAVTTYVLGFGLTPSSLRRLSAKSGVPYENLLAVLKSPLAAVEINIELIKKVLLQFGSKAYLMAAEEACSFFPIIGIPIAMSLSAVTTYKILKLFLNMLAEDALRVSERVLRGDPSSL